jgi:hypothetical protein
MTHDRASKCNKLHGTREAPTLASVLLVPNTSIRNPRVFTTSTT